MLKLIIENAILILPLIVLQVGLMIFCIIKIMKEGVQNLNKPVWLLIVIFVNLVGPVIFLLLGRSKGYYEKD